jgi:hypothetical protein
MTRRPNTFEARSLRARASASIRLAVLLLGVLGTAERAVAQSTPPLSFAAVGTPVDAALDSLENRVQNQIGRAAQAGSMIAGKAARDVQLIVDAMRQEFHDESKVQWDRLAGERVSLFREVDTKLKEIDGLMSRAGSLQDQVYLDAESLIQRLPFTKTVNSIRRIDGASQYYRDKGVYRIIVRANFVRGGMDPPRVKMEGRYIDQSFVSILAPNDLVLTLPVAALNAYFDGGGLRTVQFALETAVPAGTYFWSSTRPARFRFRIELFPKFPFKYKVKEHVGVQAISNAIAVQPGEKHIVPGCGNSGCEARHPYCVAVPKGAKPVGGVNWTDDYGGYGGWYEEKAGEYSVCAVYVQKSHNQTRTVGFDATYYPATTVVEEREVDLEEMSIVPVSNPKGVARLGSTYSMRFSPTMESFDVILEAFTGETYVATPGRVSPFLELKLEDKSLFKRATLVVKAPW